MTVLAAHTWPTNAELIADVARLGYLRVTDRVLDPTPGDAAVWWKTWRPGDLVTVAPATDFRRLPYGDASFDAVAYDPPYVCPGGRETSGIQDMYRRYGILDCPRTPAALQTLMNDGLTECARVVKPAATKKLDDRRPNGVVLMKCADYNWGGKYWAGTYLTLKVAEELGLVLEDRFEFLGGPGPQPTKNPDGSARRQRSARRNLSTLLVLRRMP